MTLSGLARERLRDLAETQRGFVTTKQAEELGVSRAALSMLAGRGTLERAATGVYRYPHLPVGEADPYMVALLWTRAPEAALSHETALDAWAICDVNPDAVHVTVSERRRIRRADAPCLLHYQDLRPEQLGWWHEVPTVTAATAIAQCITLGTPTYLLRQAIENGHAQGRVSTAERDALTARLGTRHV